MSGGAFEYQQYKIGEIADSIQSELDRQGKEIPKDCLWGSPEYYESYPEEKFYPKYSSEVQIRMKAAVHFLRLAHIYAQRVDWYLSGDDGEDSFIERLEKELNEFLDKK